MSKGPAILTGLSGDIPEGVTPLGPINLSEGLLSLFVALAKDNPDPDMALAKVCIDVPTAAEAVAEEHGFKLKELEDLYAVTGPDYYLGCLVRINGTGLKSHMRADEIPIDWKFQIDGVEGGSGVLKDFRRIKDPLGANGEDDFFQGRVIARITNSHDGTEGDTVLIPRNAIVRPAPEKAEDYYLVGSIRTGAETTAQQEDYEKWKDAHESIGAKVKEHLESLGQEVHVLFSMGDNAQALIDYDNVYISGRVQFVELEHASEGTPYVGEVLEDPTLGDIVLEANNMIQVTQDSNHAYLENVQPSKDQPPHGDFVLYEFVMGS